MVKDTATWNMLHNHLCRFMFHCDAARTTGLIVIQKRIYTCKQDILLTLIASSENTVIFHSFRMRFHSIKFRDYN